MSVRRTAATAAIVLGFLVVASRADANDAPGCGAFSLTGGEKAIEVIDESPAGKSIGDERAGWRRLLDGDGGEVAEVHFVATLTAPGGGDRGDVLASQYFVRFGGDWMVTASLYELPNADVATKGAGNARLVVTGGTGPFAGAQGTITIEAGNPPTYVFDVRCGR